MSVTHVQAAAQAQRLRRQRQAENWRRHLVGGLCGSSLLRRSAGPKARDSRQGPGPCGQMRASIHGQTSAGTFKMDVHREWWRAGSGRQVLHCPGQAEPKSRSPRAKAEAKPEAKAKKAEVKAAATHQRRLVKTKKLKRAV